MSASAPPDDNDIAAEARAMRAARNWPAAIAQYHRAIERQPQNAALLFELGDCYRQSGDMGRAIQAFERAIALDPDKADAYRAAADAALAQAAKPGIPSKAVADLKKFAAMYLVALARRQSHHGIAGDPAASLREAVALDPKSAPAYASLGEFLEARGHYSDAEKSLRRAIALDPKLASAHVALGNALQSLGRYQEMDAAYRRALDIDPSRREVRESMLSRPLINMLYDSAATPAQILDQAPRMGRSADRRSVQELSRNRTFRQYARA